MGVELFERTAKGALVTPVGQQVVEIARELLAASDRIVACASPPRSPLTGSLELGSASTITP